jgi:carbamoyl-phosphate synthase large subunit
VKGELLTVAVSGIEPDDASQAGIGIARGLRRVFGNRVRVVGLSREAWRIPPGAERDFDLGLGLGEELEAGDSMSQVMSADVRFGVDVLIPSRTAEAAGLLSQRDALRQARIAASVPSQAAWERAVNPGQRSFRETGMRPLESVVVPDETSTRAAAKALGLPLVVKSTRHTEVVHTLEAVLASSERLRKPGNPVALQKYLSGEEYNVAVVRDGTSGHCVSVALRKTLVTRFGQIWAGVTAAETDVRELVERATAAFDWHGPCELDIVKDRRGGFWLRDFAPCLPAWHEMGVAAGVNLSLAVFYVAVGRRLRASSVGGSGIYYAHRATDLIGEMSRSAASASAVALGTVTPGSFTPGSFAPGTLAQGSVAQGPVAERKPRAGASAVISFV